MQRIKIVLAATAITLLIVSLSYAGGGYDCYDCHDPDNPGIPIRNCLASGCHDTYEKGNHHTTGLAFAGMCNMCHNPNLVDNYDEENPLFRPASESTPTVYNCNTCHKGHANPIDENGDPYPYPIYEIKDLEHMGFEGYSVNCILCHGDPLDFSPENPYLFRYCQTCHSLETLHSIAGHVEGGFWYDENGIWTEITQNERCQACHITPPTDTMLYVYQRPSDPWSPGFWLGTYDTKYSELNEAECRICHGTSVADRHHALYGPCNDPLSPSVIDTNACQGMSPIVGVRMAHITLNGTNFGEQGSLKCGDYKVQMKEGTTWIDLPVISWYDNLIECILPPWTFSNYTYHKIRVKTPAGKSNRRNFYVLPAPVVDRIEDDTGRDIQGPAGGWLTIYSKLDSPNKGTFGGARRSRWYTDALGGSCPQSFGSIYVVTFTSSSGRYAATIYTDWNVSGNNDSFKIKLENLWRDDDGDYYKDRNEPKYGPNGDFPLSNLPLEQYSVQVCLIIYADSNGNDRFSGNKDTIYQVVKSKSEIIYELTAP
jgi:hypothetical protein